mgnify:CR=1 FL=1
MFVLPLFLVARPIAKEIRIRIRTLKMESPVTYLCGRTVNEILVHDAIWRGCNNLSNRTIKRVTGTKRCWSYFR